MDEQSAVIGLCVARIQKIDNSRILRAICDYAKADNIDVIIYNVFVKMDVMNKFAKGELSIFEKIDFDNIDVLVILAETIRNDDIINLLYKRASAAGRPVITVDHSVDGCFNILLDYATSFRRIVKHVIEDHKCKNVYFMAGMRENEFSDARIDIYKNVLAENDMEFKAENLAYGDFWEAPARDACERWLKTTKELPDAIICANDVMAITVCNCLRERSIRVPEDVIVTGFDGIDMERYCSPRLTTASNNVNEIGQRTISYVMSLIDNPNQKPEDVSVPYYIRLSESCGCNINNDRSNSNRMVMDTYDKLEKIQINVIEVFQMMAGLTDGISATTMIKNLEGYMKHFNIFETNMVVCVNRQYCEDTDLPEPDEGDEYTLIASLFKKRYTTPMSSVGDEDEKKLFDSLAEHNGQVLLVPLHSQEEVYGYIAFSNDNNVIDYIELYDFMMGITQVFGTVMKKARLHDLYIRDSLTMLYNRRGFYSEIEQLMKKLSRKTKMVFLISIDLDGLKYINDNYGHGEGDYAIKTVGNAINSVIQDEGVSARFGGDEYMVAFIVDEKHFEFDYYKGLADKINENVMDASRVSNKPYTIAISYGIANAVVNRSNDIDLVMKKADDAMYDCKVRHHAVRDSERDD